MLPQLHKKESLFGRGDPLLYISISRKEQYNLKTVGEQGQAIPKMTGADIRQAGNRHRSAAYLHRVACSFPVHSGLQRRWGPNQGAHARKNLFFKWENRGMRAKLHITIFFYYYYTFTRNVSKNLRGYKYFILVLMSFLLPSKACVSNE